MSKMKISLILSAAILAACGGGGGGGDVTYNYKQHDGSYSCKRADSPQSQALTRTFAFTEKSVTMSDPNGPAILDEKVGFIQGKPYYIKSFPPMAATVYFNNNILSLHQGLPANTPDKLTEAPYMEEACIKL